MCVGVRKSFGSCGRVRTNLYVKAGRTRVLVASADDVRTGRDARTRLLIATASTLMVVLVFQTVAAGEYSSWAEAPTTTSSVQTAITTPQWAAPGNWMVWSFAESGQLPGGSPVWDRETVNMSVTSVSGYSVQLTERWNGTSTSVSNGSAITTINATGLLDHGIDLFIACQRPVGGIHLPCHVMSCQSFCFYIPTPLIPSYLNYSQRAMPVLSYFAFLLQNASSVSQKSVSTKFGPVETWTLSMKSSVETNTTKGSGEASISFDSGLGLLISARVSENGTYSSVPIYAQNGTIVGHQSGKEYRTLNASLIMKSSGVHLSPGVSSAQGYSSYVIAGGGVAVLAVAVAVVVVIWRKSRRAPQTQP